MSSAVGYIPNEVHFYLQAPLDKPAAASGNWRHGSALANVRPAFPVNARLPADAATRSNAVVWSKGRYNHRTGKYSHHTDIGEDLQKNVARGGYRLQGVESRNEGGRAWKVLTPDNYLVDMREDVFLPILLEFGIPAGPAALIPGEFVWCVRGSQIRLERVGSENHAKYATEAERYSEKGKKKPGTASRDLVIGGVYDGPDAKSWVYLGRVRSEGKKKWAFLELARPNHTKPDITLQERADNALEWASTSHQRAYGEMFVRGSGNMGNLIGNVSLTLTGPYRFKSPTWLRLQDVTWE